MVLSSPGDSSTPVETSCRYRGTMADIAHASNGGQYGDADVPLVASLFGEPSRARILMALADGRALPASRLANEAGLSAQGTSAQLTRLLTAGLITVEPSRRHRYYRLADRNVAAVLEAMAAIAPPMTVRSLREGTHANALRTARTCYDHLAGQLGVAITGALLTEKGPRGHRRHPHRSTSRRRPAVGSGREPSV